MADSNEPTKDDEFLEDGETPNPDYEKPEDGGENDDDGAAPSTDDAAEGDDSKEGDDDDSSDDDAGDDDTEPDVPVRSTASHIISRQKKKIEKLTPKDTDDAASADAPTTDDAEGGEGEADAETQTAVQKEVSRQIKPLVDNAVESSDAKELETLITNEPEAKKYEKRIKVYMAHPSYKGVAAAVIFHHLAYAMAQKAGADKKKAADLDAAQNAGAGSDNRPTEKVAGDVPTADELDAMSDKEIEEMEAKAKQGGFLPKT